MSGDQLQNAQIVYFVMPFVTVRHNAIPAGHVVDHVYCPQHNPACHTGARTYCTLANSYASIKASRSRMLVYYAFACTGIILQYLILL